MDDANNGTIIILENSIGETTTIEPVRANEYVQENPPDNELKNVDASLAHFDLIFEQIDNQNEAAVNLSPLLELDKTKQSSESLFNPNHFRNISAGLSCTNTNATEFINHTNSFGMKSDEDVCMSAMSSIETDASTLSIGANDGNFDDNPSIEKKTAKNPQVTLTETDNSGLSPVHETSTAAIETHNESATIIKDSSQHNLLPASINIQQAVSTPKKTETVAKSSETDKEETQFNQGDSVVNPTESEVNENNHKNTESTVLLCTFSTPTIEGDSIVHIESNNDAVSELVLIEVENQNDNIDLAEGRSEIDDNKAPQIQEIIVTLSTASKRELASTPSEQCHSAAIRSTRRKRAIFEIASTAVELTPERLNTSFVQEALFQPYPEIGNKSHEKDRKPFEPVSTQSKPTVEHGDINETVLKQTNTVNATQSNESDLKRRQSHLCVATPIAKQTPRRMSYKASENEQNEGEIVVGNQQQENPEKPVTKEKLIPTKPKFVTKLTDKCIYLFLL